MSGSRTWYGSMLALVTSDFEDLRRNLAVLPLLLYSPLLALLMRRIEPAQVTRSDTMPLLLVCTQVLTAMAIVSLSVSEERGKRILDALLVAPIGQGHIMGAKLVFAAATTLFVQMLVVAAMGGVPGAVAPLVAVDLAGIAFFALFGIVVGAMAPNQKVAGAINTPLSLIFMLLPVAGQASRAWSRTAAYIPSSNPMALFHAVMAGGGGGGLLSHGGRDLACTCVWLAVSGLGAAWALRRQSGWGVHQ